MRYNLTYKTKHFFAVLIKLSIVIGAFYFIYNRLAENEGLDLLVFLDFVSKQNTLNTISIMALIGLSSANWFLEVVKWQNLVKVVTPIGFVKALEQSLGGHTASLITPNRIGDYGAKAIYFIKPQRPKIVLLNLIGNCTQMLATVLFGTFGIILFVQRYQIDIDYFKLLRFAFILVLVFAFLSFGLKKMNMKLKGHTIEKVIEFMRSLKTMLWLKLIILSIGRYLIFSFQFYYLLHLFGVEVNYFRAMVVISSMYLLASIIPTISIFDLVIKGSVAIFLFNFVQVNELTILSVTTIMWVLNFAIPSLFGSYYVLNFKIAKAD